MRVKTLQILWHGKEPVLSAHFHPSGLLATAGADKEIKLWKVSAGANGSPHADYVASLSHHANAVNVVRFSPSGELLASGADGGEILLWRQVKGEGGGPQWKVHRSLSRHEKDVLDLCWAPDGAQLASASVDNSVLVWDAQRAVPETFLKDHGHYVQGVAWDPLGSFLASSSADRTCRIYSLPKPPPPPPAADGSACKPGSVGAEGKGGKGAKSRPAVVRCVHVLQKRELLLEKDKAGNMGEHAGEGAGRSSEGGEHAAWGRKGKRFKSLRAITEAAEAEEAGGQMGGDAATIGHRQGAGEAAGNSQQQRGGDAPSNDQQQEGRDVSNGQQQSPPCAQQPSPQQQQQQGGTAPQSQEEREGSSALQGPQQNTSPRPQMEAPAAAAPKAAPSKVPLFADETLPSFFRRMAWAPDGTLLAVPAGVWRDSPASPPEDVTYLFPRGDLGKPLLALPSLGRPSLVVRFCPLLFHLPPSPQPSRSPAPPSTSHAKPAASPSTAASVTATPVLAAAAAPPSAAVMPNPAAAVLPASAAATPNPAAAALPASPAGTPNPAAAAAALPASAAASAILGAASPATAAERGAERLPPPSAADTRDGNARGALLDNTEGRTEGEREALGGAGGGAGHQGATAAPESLHKDGGKTAADVTEPAMVPQPQPAAVAAPEAAATATPTTEAPGAASSAAAAPDAEAATSAVPQPPSVDTRAAPLPHPQPPAPNPVPHPAPAAAEGGGGPNKQSAGGPLPPSPEPPSTPLRGNKEEGQEGEEEEELPELPVRLPYRLVLAVASSHSVFLFDTVTPHPIAMAAGLHLMPITDLAWSPDGRSLIVASQDGFCSAIAFEPGELGRPFTAEDLPQACRQHLHRLHPLYSEAEAAAPQNSPATPAAAVTIPKMIASVKRAREDIPRLSVNTPVGKAIEL